MLIKRLVRSASIIVIVETACLVYSNTFSNSFHLDDFISIVNNSPIKHLDDPLGIWHWWPTRLITQLSFALNYLIGQQNVFGYHLVNLALHILAALFLYILIRTILVLPKYDNVFPSGQKEIAALFTALVFLCHPIQTQAVTYIVQRATILSGLFSIISLLLFIRWQLSFKKPSQSILNSLALCSGIALFASLAMFSKENAIILPALMWLCDRFIHDKEDKRKWYQSAKPFLLLLLVIPATYLFTHTFSIHKMTRAPEELTFEYPRLYYFFTQIKVIATYLRLILIPVRQSLHYDCEVVKNIFSPSYMFAIASLVSIIILAMRLRKREPLISFGLFWFLLALIPESSVFPIYDLISEHRLYLPLAGLSMILPYILFRFFGKKYPGSCVAVLIALSLAYGLMTYHRNFAWATEETLCSDSIRKYPKAYTPYINRAFYYRKMGQFEAALNDLNEAVRLKPQLYIGYFNRGNIHRLMNRFEEAIADYSTAITFNPRHALSYYNRAVVRLKSAYYELALEDFDRTLKIDPNYGPAYYNRAQCLFNLNRADEGRADLVKAGQL